jgi:hypothetical protein
MFRHDEKQNTFTRLTLSYHNALVLRGCRERMDLLATMYNAKTREVLADYNRVRNDVSHI